MAAGRFFDYRVPLDSSDHIIVNEAFVRQTGIENPIGKKVIGLNNAGFENPSIIGVIKDFNYQSLERPVDPLWMVLAEESSMDDLLLRIESRDVSENHIKIGRSLE